jgi:hypothetical protein
MIATPQRAIDGLTYLMVNRYGAVTGIAGATDPLIRRIVVCDGRCSSICGIVRWALSKSPITRVWIPSSVEILERSCFHSCKSLRELSLERDSGMRQIEESVFFECSSLGSGYIPSTVETIAKNCFRSCSRLAVVLFGENSRLHVIGDSCFRDCVSLTAVTIPYSVELLSKHSFAWCSSLIGFSFEQGSELKTIGESAFAMSTSLRQFCLPRSVEFISGSSFGGVRLSLLTIEAGSPHFSVSNLVIYDLAGRTLVLQSDVCDIVSIDDSVEEIGCACFSHSISVREVLFGAMPRIRQFGQSAFASSSITKICIPRSVEIVGKSCFTWCKRLRNVSFETHSQLKKLSSAAFSNSSLPSLTIPNRVEIIGKFCFASCKQLSRIEFEPVSRLKRIKRTAFFSCLLIKKLVFPNSIEFLDGSAFSLHSLDEVSLSGDSPRFFIQDGILFDRIEHAIIRSFSAQERFVIDVSIEILAKACFSSSPFLQAVTFPTSRLRRIEDEAFALSTLRGIRIPRTVVSIGCSVFCCCSVLSEVFFEAVSALEEIGCYAFWSCSCLETIFLPRCLRRIGKSCFAFCGGLTKVKFESASNLTQLGADAFAHTRLVRVSISAVNPVQVSNAGCVIVVTRVSVGFCCTIDI